MFSKKILYTEMKELYDVKLYFTNVNLESVHQPESIIAVSNDQNDT